VKIKEVCERTGLTDRAIRLYMDSGLIEPKEEWSYTGRRAISFSEDDVKVLENVATLRRTEFSIADIVRMKEEPDAISEIIAEHKKAIAKDIESKNNILSTLERCDCRNLKSYAEIAEEIRASVSHNSIPKEDSEMSLKEVKRIIRGRIPTLIALVLLVTAVFCVGSVALKTSFASVGIMSGGGFEYTYEFSIGKLGQHAVLLSAVAMIAFSAVALIVYLAGSNRRWLIAGGCLCVLSLILLLALPTADAKQMYFYEFLNYRSVFKFTPLYSEKTPEALIRSIKFIPLIISAVLCAVGFFTEKDIDKTVS